MYVVVENGKVVRSLSQLPRVMNNVSGFHHLSEEDLKKHGIHKVVEESRTLKKDEVIHSHNIEFKDGVAKKVAVVKKKKDLEEEALVRQQHDLHVYKVECLELAHDVLRMTDHCLLEDAPYSKKDIDKFKAMRIKLYEMYSDMDKVYDGLKDKLEGFKNHSKTKLMQPIEI